MEKYITKNGLFKNSDNVFLGWIFPSKKKKKKPFPDSTEKFPYVQFGSITVVHLGSFAQPH